MSLSNTWKELFEYSKNSAVGSFDDQTLTFEYAALFADSQNERLSTGIEAISVLLDDAIRNCRLEEVVAVGICGLLAAVTGLSVQLAAVSSDANRKLASIIATRAATSPETYSLPLSPD